MTIDSATSPAAAAREPRRGVADTGGACRGTLRRILAAAAGRADILPAAILTVADDAPRVSPAVWPKPATARLH